MAVDGADAGGVRKEVSDRFDRWIVPVIRWVRRTLWIPMSSGVVAAALAGAAAIVWLGADEDGLTLAALVALVALAPVLGVWLFFRVLGELQRLPQTVMAAPENLSVLKAELGDARGEIGDLRRSGLLGLPSALRWLRRTLGRLDAVGVTGIAAAVAALHPIRLAGVLVLAYLSVVALPVAALALLLAVQT